MFKWLEPLTAMAVALISGGVQIIAVLFGGGSC
jgi:hypothetical protein